MQFTRGVTFVLTGSYYPDDLHNLVEDAVGFDINRNDLKSTQRLIYISNTIQPAPNDGEIQWQPSTKRLLIWDAADAEWLELARSDTTQPVIAGLEATYFDDHRITIEAGKASDAVESVTMQLAAQKTLDVDVFGPDGRDETSLVQGKWYYIYLIQNPESGLVATVASQNAVAPDTSNQTAFPTFQPTVGTVRYRKIFAIFLADTAAKDIFVFTARGSKSRRQCFWDNMLTEYFNSWNGGPSAGWHGVTMTVPPLSLGVFEAYFFHVTASSTSENQLQFRTNGLASANGNFRLWLRTGENTGPAGSHNSSCSQFQLPVDADSKLEWELTIAGVGNQTSVRIGTCGWEMEF